MMGHMRTQNMYGKIVKQIIELVHCVGYSASMVQDARSTKYKIYMFHLVTLLILKYH
jgi:hypothetical protein